MFRFIDKIHNGLGMKDIFCEVKISNPPLIDINTICSEMYAMKYLCNAMPPQRTTSILAEKQEITQKSNGKKEITYTKYIDSSGKWHTHEHIENIIFILIHRKLCQR